MYFYETGLFARLTGWLLILVLSLWGSPIRADGGFPYAEAQSMVVFVDKDWGILFGGAPITVFTPMREIVAKSMKQASRERMMLIGISDYVFEAMISTRYERVTVYIGRDWISDSVVAGFLEKEAFENFSRYVGLRKRHEGRTREYMVKRSDWMLAKNLAERDREREVQAIYDASLVLYREQQEKQGAYSIANDMVNGEYSQDSNEINLYPVNEESVDVPALPGSDSSQNIASDGLFPEGSGSGEFGMAVGGVDNKPETADKNDKNSAEWFLAVLLAMMGFVCFFVMKARK
jgi:hypothetical protein